MGSGQSLISKEDMEAYKELTYFTEAEIKTCLKRFVELLDPKVSVASIHEPGARVRLEDVMTGLQELKVNPFAERICLVFAQNQQFMAFEDFLDMLSSLR
jgi:Ca2+-binding EF-hand superfamily protein